MPGYTDPFGGSTIQPAQVGYSAIALVADITVVWPQDSFSAATPIFSRLTDVTPSAGGFAITLPDARKVSPGYDAFYCNRGAFTFSVKAADGSIIANVTAGESRYIYLTDNSTEAGTWRSFSIGAFSTPADAAGLAGRGLAAEGSMLRVSSQTSTFAANYPVVAADLAKNYVWTGGVGQVILPLVNAVNIGSTFFFSLANQGSGALTVVASGGELVDGAASIVLQPTESCLLHAGPTAWYTVGRGRNTQFNYTLLSKSVTGGTVTLTPSEEANVAQIYTGVLVSGCLIVLPSVVQIYFVSNQTTGAFTLTFKTAGVGSTIAVPQGQNAVLLCDGLNVVNASTTASGLSSLALAVGSVGAPSLSFVGDPSTGVYQIASGNVSITISGVATANFSSAGLQLSRANSSLSFSDTGAGTSKITSLATGALRVGTNNAAGTLVFATGLDVASLSISAAGNVSMSGNLSVTGTLTVGGAGPYVLKTGDTMSGPLIVTGASGSAAFSAVGGGPGASALQFGYNFVMAGGRENLFVTGTNGLSFGTSGNANMDLRTNGVSRVDIGGAGNVAINAPSGGTTLVATGLTGGVTAHFGLSGATNNPYIDIGGSEGGSYSRIDANGSTVAACNLRLQTLGTDRVTIGSAGNVTIAAPGSGYALTVVGSGGLSMASSGVIDFSSVSATPGQINYYGTNFLELVSRNAAAGVKLYVGNAIISTAWSAAGNVTIAAPSSGVGLTQTGFAGSDTVVFNGGTSGSFRVTDRGLPYGTSIHNNAGSVTGTANQYIASGTYTPTLTNSGNVAATTSAICNWMRVGNVVTVSGNIVVDVSSANTNTLLGISLPIASNFTVQEQCGGVGAGVSTSAAVAAAIGADTANDRAIMNWKSDADTAAQAWGFSFTYVVL